MSKGQQINEAPSIVSIDEIIKKAVKEGIEAGRQLVEKRPDQINTAIKKAVKEGIEAGYKQAQKRPADIYKATERRLYALADLRDKVRSQQEYLDDIEHYGLPEHSNDLIRFQRNGSRLAPKDIEAAVKQDLKAKIAANEFAIIEILDALDPLTNDPYYLALSGRFFDNMHDDDIADQLHCDPRTVRRNRGRLVHRAAIRLYGIDAV